MWFSTAKRIAKLYEEGLLKEIHKVSKADERRAKKILTEQQFKEYFEDLEVSRGIYKSVYKTKEAVFSK